MTYSMTGFARVQAESTLGTLSIELKAVNSRYLEVFFKMPEAIKPFENTMRQILAKHLTRGKIECAIRFYATADEHIRFYATADGQLSINADYVNALLSASKDIAATHGIEGVSMGELLRLPGVLIEQVPDSEALKNWLLPLFEQAVSELVEQRQSEGRHLNALISERVNAVQAIIAEAAQNYAQSIDKVQDKLHKKLDEVAKRYQSQMDELRFEQEMIYLLQKMDIAEEIDRLNGHISEINKLLAADKPVGRKLDFLMQEMNRESNTIASKSQHLGLSMNAVELKVLLEQMREQIQNIE